MNILTMIVHAHQHFSIRALFEVNQTCPRLVYMNVSNDGFGDQLNHVYAIMAAAHALDATPVVDDSFGKHHNKHWSQGYKRLFDLMGFPHLRTYSEANTAAMTWQDDMLDNLLVEKPTLSCNSGMRTGLYTCQVNQELNIFCPNKISSLIESTIKPYLEDLAQLTSSSLTEPSWPINLDAVNVVWHLRTGDICLLCDANAIFTTISNFVTSAIGPVKYQNIIVSSNHQRAVETAKVLRNVVIFNHEDPVEAARVFLTADILITMGSSFAPMVCWPTRLYRPLILQMPSKESLWYPATNKASAYSISEDRAFRVDWNGKMLHETPEDLTEILYKTLVFERIAARQAK